MACPLSADTEGHDSSTSPPLLPLLVLLLQGVKKTKLGLREFVKLGDFQQIIDTQQQQAVRHYQLCWCRLCWRLLCWPRLCVLL